MILPPPSSTLFPYTTLFRSSLTHEGRANAPAPVFGIHQDHRNPGDRPEDAGDRKSTRLNSSHRCISYAVFCLKKKIMKNDDIVSDARHIEYWTENSVLNKHM